MVPLKTILPAGTLHGMGARHWGSLRRPVQLQESGRLGRVPAWVGGLCPVSNGSPRSQPAQLSSFRPVRHSTSQCAAAQPGQKRTAHSKAKQRAAELYLGSRREPEHTTTHSHSSRLETPCEPRISLPSRLSSLNRYVKSTWSHLVHAQQLLLQALALYLVTRATTPSSVGVLTSASTSACLPACQLPT